MTQPENPPYRYMSSASCCQYILALVTEYTTSNTRARAPVNRNSGMEAVVAAVKPRNQITLRNQVVSSITKS